MQRQTYTYFAFCYEIVSKRNLSMVSSLRWSASLREIPVHRCMRKRAVCAVGEDRRLRTVPVLLESFRIFCSCMHQRCTREAWTLFWSRTRGPPFSLSVLLTPLRLFARVLPLLLPLMLQLPLRRSLAYQYLCRFVFVKISGETFRLILS